MRLFVSVDLPEAFTEPIADLQAEFEDASGVNLVDPAQSHVTLKFLGEVSETRLQELEDELEAAVSEADVDPFSARFGGLGVFPDLEYIRVIWLGLETGGSQLRQLHEAIERRTTAMGFEPEQHEFTPHVTLGRMEHAGGKDHVQDVVRSSDPTVGETEITDVRLTESTLTDDGPVYSTVERFSLE